MTVAPVEVAVEDLVGRVVRTASGRPVGRIDDLRVEPHGEEYLVSEIILAELGLRARLIRMATQLPTFKSLGVAAPYRTRAIPWQWLDLSDPQRPRFRSPESPLEEV
jgi:sporulation protein YlmC with PRC-barrel domain